MTSRDQASLSRRRFLGACGALGALSFASPALAVPPSLRPARPLRMAWPWPVHAPDPFASNDLAAALLGGSLFPPLYARAIDGYLEPRAAIAAPKERKPGFRIDLAPWVRPSDVVASITRARSGGARLWLKDVPVPRIDGLHGILFPFVLDADVLMHRLSTPLCGVVRIEPHKLEPSTAWELALEVESSKSILRVKRKPFAVMSPTLSRTSIRVFELEGPLPIDECLRGFERGDLDLGWLGDGLFRTRDGARSVDLGPLAYVAILAGNDAHELAEPGAVAAMVEEEIPADRLWHLGLFRRGHAAPSPPARPAPAVPRDLAILVRASAPLVVEAADAVARELGAVTRAVDDAAFEKALTDRTFGLAFEVVRAIDDTAEGLAAALATLDGATTLPAQGTTASAYAAESRAAIGWEIALVGAETSDPTSWAWLPRAPFGGLDLEAGAMT